jgi:heat shock protein HslJ
MKVLLRSLSLVAAVLLVAACLNAHDVLTDRRWRLVEIGGAQPVADAHASFDADGHFFIGTGCSNVLGDYHLDANRIVLDSEGSGAMRCGEPAAARQEEAFLAAIGGRPAYAFDTGTGNLRLTSESGEVLLFESS